MMGNSDAQPQDISIKRFRALERAACLAAKDGDTRAIETINADTGLIAANMQFVARGRHVYVRTIEQVDGGERS